MTNWLRLPRGFPHAAKFSQVPTLQKPEGWARWCQLLQDSHMLTGKTRTLRTFYCWFESGWECHLSIGAWYMWLCLGLQIPRILFNSGCSCHGRVVNTGIGIGLQNRKCGSDSHLALQQFFNGSVDKLDIVTCLSRRNLWVQVPAELQFQWPIGAKVVSPPFHGGDVGAVPTWAEIWSVQTHGCSQQIWTLFLV